MPSASDNRGGLTPWPGTLVSALHVHVVFVTAYQRGVLDADMLRSCRTRRGQCALGAELRQFNDQDHHMHLLAGYPPKVAVPPR